MLQSSALLSFPTTMPLKILQLLYSSNRGALTNKRTLWWFSDVMWHASQSHFWLAIMGTTYTFSLFPIVFQIMLFPVRQMITVISGNEIAREPSLCWEESQSPVLCEKLWYGLGQRDEAKEPLGQLQQRSAWILINCPFILKTGNILKRQPSMKATLWRRQRYLLFFSLMHQRITVGRPQMQNYFLSPWTVMASRSQHG